ncbi:membrane-associated proteins in eicosanoid and glutathione metabolism [Hyaloscypha variabilis F]|uniref:Membrane-associated proteins in eicosanoid and glutathione metabolism n=1 Tax=Hyaloscypha variabilis (strain UAMH 11265 / GT02V1 / F) TaxID=1149755 RepID=A0A2J6RQG8_HYAVF|nr:membrane-associated proteins in eicosanoid and glutathione metabolism [Hyaloscypha variabilis F]
MTTITIDPAYGWVILAAASTFFLNSYHSINTGNYRKIAKCPYPAAYAPAERTDEDAHRFNCAQRAHANFIENQPSAVAALLLAGLQFPISSALMGAGWTVSRYMYMVGYSQGGEGGKGGIYFWVFQAGLAALATYNGVAMILGW